MRENADQNNSEYRHFLHSAHYHELIGKVEEHQEKKKWPRKKQKHGILQEGGFCAYQKMKKKEIFGWWKVV